MSRGNKEMKHKQRTVYNQLMGVSQPFEEYGLPTVYSIQCIVYIYIY